MAESLFEHYKKWKKEKIEDVNAAAKNISKDMVFLAAAASPVRKYSTRTQTVSHITAHRYPGVRSKAVHTAAPEKEQPGYFRNGWTTGQIKLKNGMIYGARNKNMPTVVHLVHYPHRLIVHGVSKGTVYGSHFLEHAEEWGAERLNDEIKKIMEKE